MHEDAGSRRNGRACTTLGKGTQLPDTFLTPAIYVLNPHKVGLQE